MVREINEVFVLFDSQIGMYTQDWPEMGIKELFGYPFFLNLEGRKIPLTVNANKMGAGKRAAFTPFHPGNGYTIDHRDFKPNLLAKKLHEMKGAKIDLSLDPLMLFIDAQPGLLNQYGINVLKIIEDTKDYQFDQETYDILRRLHLQLFFLGSGPEVAPDEEGYRASSTFEARSGGQERGMIWFPHFYPVDTGPLPEARPERYEGLFIRVPGDLEDLSKIKAKFVLRKEPPSLGK